MTYVLAPIVGSGTDGDAFRVDGARAIIDLRADSTSSDGWALAVMHPDAERPADAATLTDAPRGSDAARERVPKAVRDRLADRLSLNLESERVGDIAAEILLSGRNDGSRWKPLRPQRNGLYRVALAGELWRRPVIAGAAEYTDDFNRSTLGADWTNLDGGFDIYNDSMIEGPTTSQTGGWYSETRFKKDLDSDNHFAQIEFVENNSSGRWIAPAVRFDSASITYYGGRCRSSDQTIEKFVNDSKTELADFGGGGGPPRTIRYEADGSTISLYNEAGIVAEPAFVGDVTDTEIVGFTRTGIQAHPNNGRVARGDNFWISDLGTDQIDPVVGRLKLRGFVSDLLSANLILSDDAVEYAYLNTGVALALDDDGVEYAHLNTGVALTLDDDGTEYAYLNTTVNAEAVVGRIRLSGGTGEAIAVGYTVGSTVLTAEAANGDDARLTWDAAVEGEALSYEVFRRSPSTGERFDPDADAVGVESTLLDFETGDTSRWDTVNVLQAVTSRVHSGTYAGYSQSGSTPGTALAETIVDGLAGGVRISKFEFWWQETSGGSHGAGVRLVNSNGDFELGIATDNPQWYVDDANGLAEVKGDDNNYDRWVRFTVTFDWDAGTFDYDFEDPTAGTTRSGSGRPLKQGVDVETIALENFDTGGGGFRTSGNAVEMWWDDVLVEQPGPDARIAKGIDVLEYVDADLDAATFDWQVFARVERSV